MNSRPHISGDLYYDPYDRAINTDPYPVWRRLRDEAPVYYNERYDFYALSRYEDVRDALRNWQGYSSARGTAPPAGMSGYTTTRTSSMSTEKLSSTSLSASPRTPAWVRRSHGLRCA